MPPIEDLEVGGKPGPGMCPPVSLTCFPLISQTCVVGGHRQGESDYGDSSMPLYFMYSKIAEEEDSKIVENCHREADGTLIFVSPQISP
jgi:hypothetical protein